MIRPMSPLDIVKESRKKSEVHLEQIQRRREPTLEVPDSFSESAAAHITASLAAAPALARTIPPNLGDADGLATAMTAMTAVPPILGDADGPFDGAAMISIPSTLDDADGSVFAAAARTDIGTDMLKDTKDEELISNDNALPFLGVSSVLQVLDDGCTTDVPAGLPLVLGDEHCLVRSITSPSCAPLRTIYAREVQEIQSANEAFGETSPLLVDYCVISPTEISAQCEASLNLNHNIVLILHKDLPSISPDKILYSVMLNEPISLHCAMNKISEIAYINTSTYAYGFIFNFIGDYSMHDNFRVNQICVTCDRIAKLKIDSITHICNLSHDVCYEPLHEFRNSRVHYELIEVVHSSSTASHVWNCFDVASSNSD